MSTSKHPNTPEWGEGDGPPDDLERDPGIGRSRGTFATGEDPEAIAGENTVEGDLTNDTTPQGGVRMDQASEANCTKANKTGGF
jgi:hypothetical protein